MIDLHVHTIFSSDGLYTPEEIFKMAVNMGLEVLSFTDHNEVAANEYGLELAKKFNITYVTGIEFNSLFENMDIHILGYFIDYKKTELQELLKKIRQKKEEQTKERCKKLKKLGFKLSEEDVFEFANGRDATGVSFLKALLKNMENLNDKRLSVYVDGEKSRSPFMHFYNDWFTPGKPAYVDIKDIDTKEAIQAILNNKGIPIIAHPRNLTEREIKILKCYGALGIEVFTTYHDKEKRIYYTNIAKTLNLLITAGSDFHGETIKKDVKLGVIGGNEYSIYENLLKFYRGYYGKKPYSL